MYTITYHITITDANYETLNPKNPDFNTLTYKQLNGTITTQIPFPPYPQLHLGQPDPNTDSPICLQITHVYWTGQQFHAHLNTIPCAEYRTYLKDTTPVARYHNLQKLKTQLEQATYWNTPTNQIQWEEIEQDEESP